MVPNALPIVFNGSVHTMFERVVSTPQPSWALASSLANSFTSFDSLVIVSWTSFACIFVVCVLLVHTLEFVVIKNILADTTKHLFFLTTDARRRYLRHHHMWYRRRPHGSFTNTHLYANHRIYLLATSSIDWVSWMVAGQRKEIVLDHASRGSRNSLEHSHYGFHDSVKLTIEVHNRKNTYVIK